MVLYVRDPVTGKFIGITTIQGESAYQIAVRNGYTGTEEDWLASLKGDPGSLSSVATTTANGLMSSTDKSKLDGITESADAVSVSQTLTSGTEVGSITVNGTATKLYAPKHTQLTFTDVSASTWVSDTTYTDYPYKCVLTCSGVLATDFAEVVLGVTEAIGGNYAPICLTAADSVTIYSKVNTTITIPTINIVRI